jgi:hypothetical protein
MDVTSNHFVENKSSKLLFYLVLNIGCYIIQMLKIKSSKLLLFCLVIISTRVCYRHCHYLLP